LLADEEVGLEVFRFIAKNHPAHLALVVTTGDNDIAAAARAEGFDWITADELPRAAATGNLRVLTTTFLAWWPHIVSGEVLGAINGPVVNFHPSLLPYNRGKHYNFWTIVEDSPFGVTLHLAEEGIDSGAILFQTPIPKTWEDTGGSLYHRAKQEILDLFRAKYDDIVSGNYTGRPQDPAAGSFHLARELEEASVIDLDRQYRARDLINLLRARTFPGKPACRFSDSGKRYEVRIEIRELTNGRD
jgi:methionyl-tRNA formyltransferase